MKKLIIFLIRQRLGLKLGERFQFTNQNNKNETYFFTDNALMKAWISKGDGREYIAHSGVSLNWLLSDKYEIRKNGENNG